MCMEIDENYVNRLLIIAVTYFIMSRTL